jgi:hypothetical protein
MIGERLWPRLAAGVLVACALLAVASWATRIGRTDASSGQSADPGTPPANGAALRSPEVLAALDGPGVWLVYLADVPGSIPAGAEPVAALDRSGRVTLRRPPPVAGAPAAERWLAAGVLLQAPLAALDAPGRAALLDVLGALSGPMELRSDQVVLRTSGEPRLEQQHLRELLRWLR